MIMNASASNTFASVKADEVRDDLFELGFTGWAVRVTDQSGWQNAPDSYVRDFIDSHPDQTDRIARVGLTDDDTAQLRAAGFHVARSGATKNGWAVGPVGHRYQAVDQYERCADFATVAEAIAFVAGHPNIQLPSTQLPEDGKA